MRGLQIDAKLFRQVRRARGLTQAELALRAGVSERTVRNAENGCRIRLDFLGFLAIAMGVETADLALDADELRIGLLEQRRVQHILTTLDALSQEQSMKEAYDLAAPNIVVNIAGPEMVPFAGEFRGVDGLRTLGDIQLNSIAYEQAPKIEDIRAYGRLVVISGRDWLRSTSTNKSFTTPWQHVYEFDNGHVVRLDNWSDMSLVARHFNLDSDDRLERRFGGYGQVMRGIQVDGKLLRQLRRDRGLTQSELATRAGVSERTLRNAEGGRRVQLKFLRFLAAALDAELADLVKVGDELRGKLLEEGHSHQIRKAFEAQCNNGDASKFIELASRIIKVNSPGPEQNSFSGKFRGLKGFRKFLHQAFSNLYLKSSITINEIRSSGNLVVVSGVTRLQGGKGTSVPIPWMQIYEFADGQLVRLDNWGDTYTMQRVFHQEN